MGNDMLRSAIGALLLESNGCQASGILTIISRIYTRLGKKEPIARSTMLEFIGEQELAKVDSLLKGCSGQDRPTNQIFKKVFLTKGGSSLKALASSNPTKELTNLPTP